LASLGALSHGDRRAGGEHQGFQAFDVENKYGKQALEYMYKAISGQGEFFPGISIRHLDSHEEKNGKFVKIPHQRQYSEGGTGFLEFVKEARDHLVKVGLASKSGITIALKENDMNNMPKFLNRLLTMPLAVQYALFQYMSYSLEGIIKVARKNGKLIFCLPLSLPFLLYFQPCISHDPLCVQFRYVRGGS
jgi:hypothetical protein